MSSLIKKQVIKVFLFTLVLALILFASSGRMMWLMGWIYVLVYAVGTTVNTSLIMLHNPDLYIERSQIKKDAKKWDKVFAPFMAGGGPAIIVITAGLDVRFQWSPQVPLLFQVAGIAAAISGHALLTWAMLTNNFFSAVVRIQNDRGHSVVTAGPYRYVRHPGYVGILASSLATPLMLGTLWPFIPAFFMLCLTVARTALEDRTLMEELAGYEDYARRVRYRLLPGVW